MYAVILMLFTLALPGCEQKTEQDFVEDELKSCSKDCTKQGFDYATHQYANQWFWCYCWNRNQPWGTYLYQKRWTGQ